MRINNEALLATTKSLLTLFKEGEKTDNEICNSFLSSLQDHFYLQKRKDSVSTNYATKGN